MRCTAESQSTAVDVCAREYSRVPLQCPPWSLCKHSSASARQYAPQSRAPRKGLGLRDLVLAGGDRAGLMLSVGTGGLGGGRRLCTADVAIQRERWTRSRALMVSTD